MHNLYVASLLIIITILSHGNAVKHPKVVCYYESWVYWRAGNGKMTVDNLNSSLCTHIVYAYLGITQQYAVSILDPYLMEDLNDLSNFAKNKGSSKAMVAIGGYSQSTLFPALSSSDSSRAHFAESVVDLLKKYHFDGVMIDWYKPTKNDSENYAKLLDKLDEKFSSTTFELGITIPAQTIDLNTGFSIKDVMGFVDIINVLTIDEHGPWESKVDYAAPISWQTEALEYWWRNGATKDKLLMSIPFFARTWHLANSADNERHASATGQGGTPGPYTNTSGMLGYNELCLMMKSNPSSFVLRRDPLTPAIYAIYGNDWISFEDSRTCTEKTTAVTSKGFGGVVVYSLANDDFRGDCSATKYPLLNAVNKGLDINDVTAGTPPPLVTTLPTTQQITQSSTLAATQTSPQTTTKSSY